MISIKKKLYEHQSLQKNLITNNKSIFIIRNFSVDLVHSNLKKKKKRQISITDYRKNIINRIN